VSRFTITDLPLTGLKLIERQRLGDSRGFLTRLFCAEALSESGLNPLLKLITLTLPSEALYVVCIISSHLMQK